MSIASNEKYHWNSKRWQWERVNKTQKYLCFEIQTISTHDDSHKYYHREYRVIFPDGHYTDFMINKRPGGNIKDIKMWLDDKAKQYGGVYNDGNPGNMEK